MSPRLTDEQLVKILTRERDDARAALAACEAERDEALDHVSYSAGNIRALFAVPEPEETP